MSGWKGCRAVGLCAVLTVAACRSAEPSAEARAEARRVWTDRCTNCHGPTGMGDGPGALVGNVKPRVLADVGWQQRVTDEHIAKVIVDGGTAAGLSPAMAPNADLADKPDVVAALVEIVRGLRP